MSDLISKGELFNRLATLQDKGEIFAAIQDMPTVDAVEVVRCKDCKYCKYGRWRGVEVPMCRNGDSIATWVAETDFCSYGERRAE